MKIIAATLALTALQVASSRAAAPTAIPYPSVLDAAAVRQARVADLNREALAIGNGDLNALVWERNGTLCLRVAKNDVWDARIDTSADPPLLKVDIANQKWSGGGGNVPSWGKPYPSPRAAAMINIGVAANAAWQCIRVGGSVSGWTHQKDADTGLMMIEGSTGDSAGWQAPVPPAARHNRVEFNISGTSGAQYYVTLNTSAGVKESGWKDSPATEETVAFTAPPNSHLTGVLIYIMTKDGKRAENRIRGIKLTGGPAPLVLTPGLPPSPTMAARLDLRRAVASVGSTTVRVLADRNVFLIESDQEVSLEEIKSAHLPAAEPGDDDGVKWLHQKMPGDQDYPGMETSFSPEPDKELFRNTLSQTRHRGCNSTILLSVGKARLSMPEAVGELRDYYKPLVQPNGMFYLPMHGFYLSECVGVAAGISEFLLQSVGNTIRVFPCWPQDKDASFTRLRAQGGFLVTAEQKGGKVVKLEITSTVGGELRVLNPWTNRIVERNTRAGESVTIAPDA